MEKTPHKFNLTSSDVAERKAFISSVKQKLSAVKQEYESGAAPASTKKSSNAEKQVGCRSPGVILLF